MSCEAVSEDTFFGLTNLKISRSSDAGETFSDPNRELLTRTLLSSDGIPATNARIPVRPVWEEVADRKVLPQDTSHLHSR